MVLHETFQLIHPPHPSSIVVLVFALFRALLQRLRVSSIRAIACPKDWAHPTSSGHHRTFKQILPASHHVRPSKSFIPCVAGRSAKLIKASRRRAIIIHRRADGRSSDSSIVPTGAYLQDCCPDGRSSDSSIAATGAYLQDCCADGR